MTKRWSLVLGLALIAAPLVAAGPVKRAAESETVVADVSARNAERAELHRSLEARELASGLSRALIVKLTPEEKATADTQSNEGRLRVGIQKSVGAVLRLTGALQFGDFAREPDGTVLWSGGIRAGRLRDAPPSRPVRPSARAPSSTSTPPTDRRSALTWDAGRSMTASCGQTRSSATRCDCSFESRRRRFSRKATSSRASGTWAPPFRWLAPTCARTTPTASSTRPVSVLRGQRREGRRCEHPLPSGGAYYICTGGLIADNDRGSPSFRIS